MQPEVQNEHFGLLDKRQTAKREFFARQKVGGDDVQGAKAPL